MQNLKVTNESEIITIDNLRGFKDLENNLFLNLEDVSKGLGFTRKDDGRVRKDRVLKYLEEMNDRPLVGTCSFADTYISEPTFYMLAMKANNITSRAFQLKVATEILPSIRKHGGYLSETANMDEVILGNIIDKCKSKKGRPTQLIQQYINGGRPAERISELSEAFGKVKPEYRMKGYNSLHSVMLALSESDRDYRDIYLSKLVSLDKSILVLNNRINGGQKAHLKRLLNEMNKEMEPALYGARFHSDEGVAWYIRKLRDHECTSIDVAKCHTRDKLKSGKQQLSVHAQFGENTKAYFIWWVGDRVSYATGEYNEVDNKPVWSSFVPSWEGNVAIFEFNGLMFEIDFTNGRGVAYSLPDVIEENV